VLRNLATGLRAGDEMADVMERLRALPRELEELYDCILQSLDSRDRRYVLKFLTFSLRPLPGQVLTLLRCYFLEAAISDSPTDVTSAFSGLAEKDALDFMRGNLDRVSKRINGRSRGLLSVVTEQGRHAYRGYPGVFYNERVVPIHRTVAEYLKSDAVQTRFKNDLEGFDWLSDWCTAFLMHVRLVTTANLACFAFRPERAKDNVQSHQFDWEVSNFILHAAGNGGRKD
jgi:hypothetical protein